MLGKAKIAQRDAINILTFWKACQGDNGRRRALYCSRMESNGAKTASKRALANLQKERQSKGKRASDCNRLPPWPEMFKQRLHSCWSGYYSCHMAEQSGRLLSKVWSTSWVKSKLWSTSWVKRLWLAFPGGSGRKQGQRS